MIKGDRNRRGRNARHTVYNLSLAIGMTAAFGLTATMGGPLLTEVHAESTVVPSDIVLTDDTVNIVGDTKLRVVTAPKDTLKDTNLDTITQGTTTLDSVSLNVEKTLQNPVKNTEKSVVENPKPEKSALDVLLEQAESDTEYIWIFLTAPYDIGGAGMTKAGAAAIMGCMQAESGLSTNAMNGSDGGYGLLQWTDTTFSSRKANLINWCNENGEDYSKLIGQLKFTMHELETKFSSDKGYQYSVYETLIGTDSIEHCLKMFFCHAEAGDDVPISADYMYAGHTSTLDLYNTRLSYANSFYNQFA